MLTIGEKAPLFTLMDAADKPLSLDDFRGKKVVVYFYPMDDTPGCTVEACSFRDAYDDILAAGAVVLGISPDGQASHERFRNKYGLPFYLLSDSDHAVAQQYGAWGKTGLPDSHEGILRSTFVVDADGSISHVFPRVTPDDHAVEVLLALNTPR